MTYENDRQREQAQAASRARGRALRELARTFPAEFQKIYEREAMAEGVMPRSARERLLAESQPELPGITV